MGGSERGGGVDTEAHTGASSLPLMATCVPPVMHTQAAAASHMRHQKQGMDFLLYPRGRWTPEPGMPVHSQQMHHSALGLAHYLRKLGNDKLLVAVDGPRRHNREVLCRSAP